MKTMSIFYNCVVNALKNVDLSAMCTTCIVHQHIFLRWNAIKIFVIHVEYQCNTDRYCTLAVFFSMAKSL